MYLKSLTLKGFKSFADRIQLTLEPGMTAVVGPNGSGKSNISDAVLWVLGERNPKHLRGQAMEDVIFAGSTARRSVSVAEVELVLDNSDGMLPVDFDEVSLTRRIFRSGESEYLINGIVARRMDFMDILHDTGLGTGTHTIIGQGNLDAVLTGKPEDRRALIEEAAGILKHKQRKERSARKLASMDEHLARVKDVAAEVERQLKPLARKASRQQAYEALSTELTQMDLLLAVDDLRRLRTAWDAVERAEKEAAAKIDVDRLASEDADARVQKLSQLLQDRGLYVGDLTERRGRFHMLVERFESVERVLREKERSIESRLSAAEGTESGSKRRIASLSAEVASLKERRDAQVAKRDALSADMSELTDALEDARAARRDADAQAARLRTDLAEAERTIADADARLSRARDDHHALAARVDALSARHDALSTELADVRGELASHEDACAAKREALDAVLAEAAHADTFRIDAADAERAARSALKEARLRLQGAAGERAAVERALASIRTRTAASAWMHEHAAHDGHARTLASLMHVPPHLEHLVEFLLGDDLTCPVAADGRTAASLLSAVREAGIGGDARVLFASDRDRSAEAAGRLIDAIDADASVQGLLDALLGDVMLVETAEEAFAGSSEALRYATPDGIVVRPRAKALAAAPDRDARSGALSRERRLSELADEQARLEAEEASAAVALENAEAALAQAQASCLSHASEKARLEGAFASAEAERRRLAQRLSTLESAFASVEADLARARDALSGASPDMDGLSARAADARARRASLQAEIEAIQSDRDAKADAEQKAAQAHADAKLDCMTSIERARSFERECAERERDLERAVRARDRAAAELVGLRRAHGRIEPLRAVVASLRAGVQGWVDDLAEKATLEQARSQSLTQSIADAREAAARAKAALDASVSALSDVRVERGRLEVQVDAAQAKIVDECGVPLETALLLGAVDDRSELEEQAASARRRIAKMGTIDSSAAEEYEAAKERFEYLSSQIEDMEAARRALKRIDAAIDARMKERFDLTFEAVNRNFQNIFASLFPGGSGELTLVGGEGDEPVGVEVNAQPRGKRITKMMLMSGGERSLTALALLFAVYKIRSTPFYILDEAEAALDDSNLRRLIAYLDELRRETQLIMITHQRRTMEMADVLYGVSMQADGVTKVVSQRLERTAGAPSGKE